MKKKPFLLFAVFTLMLLCLAVSVSADGSSICGDNLSTVYYSGTEESWNNGNDSGHEHSYYAVITYPTCTERGYTTYICYDCGDSFVDNYTEVAAHWYYCTVTYPTCTEGGYTTYTCHDCDDSFVDNYTEVAAHWYVRTVTYPTCTEGGYTTYTCRDCGDTFVGNYTEVAAHNYIPFYNDNGTLSYYYCMDCQATFSPDIFATEHNFYVVSTTAPTCTMEGYSVFACTHCNYSYIGAFKDTVEHKYEIVSTTAPTCTMEGYSVFACTHCDDIYIGAFKGTVEHKYEIVSTTAPTCTMEGYSVFACTHCDDSYIGAYVYATGHSFGEWYVTKAPTCTETGEELRECANCVIYETRELDTMGHDYSSAVTAPTCTADGYTIYTCANCGDSYVSDYVDALGHTPGEEATCTTNQYCTVCKEVVKWSLGHKYAHQVIEPTCTEDGYVIYTCIRCSESYTTEYVDPITLILNMELGLLGETGYWNYDAEYMLTVIRWEFEYLMNDGEYTVTLDAAEVEAVLNKYFAMSEDKLAQFRAYEYAGYDTTNDTYTFYLGGGFGGFLNQRDYLGYVDCSTHYNVFYCVVTYDRLNDHLPSDVNEWKYAEELGWPDTIEYDGNIYKNGPEGYYRVIGYQPYGRVISVEINGDVVRILDCVNYIEEDLPENFDDKSGTTTGHSYSNWMTAEAPTCTEVGEERRYCENCGSHETREASALGHEFSEKYTIDTDPTYEASGQKSRHCRRCDEITDITEMPQLVNTAEIYGDVKVKSWFREAVDYVVTNGLMNGMTADKFEPNTTMSRAMLVTVLWRLAGEPETDVTVPFTDLKQAWYKDAVAWAYENSIVNGTSETKFSPNGNITREQMATILYRYSEYCGEDMSNSADISAFPDANKVSKYARDAIAWANAEGLITGTTENGTTVLAPRASATRAQVATILMRYCENN